MPYKLSLRSTLAFSVVVLSMLSFGFDGSLARAQDFQFADLVGTRVDMQTTKNYFTDVEVEEVEPGKLDNSVKHFKLRYGKKTSRVVASKVVEMHQAGKNLDVSYDKKNKCVIQDSAKRTERISYERETNGRLKPEGHRLWKHLTVEEQEVFLKGQAKFVDEAKKKLAGVPLRQVETKFFTFVTDLNRAEVDGYIAYLDGMYAELCKAFGLPPEKNIWAGKCIVFAFRSERTYLGFEAEVMKIGPSQISGTQGLCHQFPDGKVIFAGYKGDNDFFGHVLVHETSHGFVHRYLSSARAPSWLNEGMADWLAEKVVKGKQIKNRQRLAALRVKATNNWNDVLNIPRITGEQYGICSVLVEILVARDKGKGKFKKFIDGIKEGHSAQECLKEHFDITYAELKGIYGQTIAGWK